MLSLRSQAFSNKRRNQKSQKFVNSDLDSVVDNDDLQESHHRNW